MLFLWFYHACRRGSPRFMMVSDHINYLTFEDPGAVHTVRRALKLAEAGDLYGAAETAGVEVSHAAVVSQGLRRGMRFSIGAEVDNDPRARPDAQNIVDAMRPDGMIRSVHFLTIEHPEKGPDWPWPFDNPEFKDLYEVIGTQRVWELYMEKLLDDIEKLPGHIVGHFYVPAIFGHWPEQAKLEEHEDKLLDACAARGMAIEINTRYLYRENTEEFKAKYRESIARLMRKAKAKDVGIAIGADAHSPKDQGNGFAEILEMLDAAEINEIVFPVAGRLARVALRATKEHLQKVKSQEPAAPPGSSISGFSRAELGLPERDEAEERALAASSKTGHDAGPRKRASSPERATKKPVKERATRGSKAKAAPQPETEPASQPEGAPEAATAAEQAPENAKSVKAAPKPKAVKAKPEAKPEAKPKAEAKSKAAAQPKAPQSKAKAKPEPKAAKAPPAKAKAEAKPKSKAAPAAVKAAPKAAAKAAPAKAKPAAKKAAAKSVKSAAKPKPKAPAKTVKAKPAIKKTAAAKKTAPAKKTVVKKSAAVKKTAAKKAPAKKSAPARKVSTARGTATKKTPSKRR